MLIFAAENNKQESKININEKIIYHRNFNNSRFGGIYC